MVHPRACPTSRPSAARDLRGTAGRSGRAPRCPRRRLPPRLARRLPQLRRPRGPAPRRPALAALAAGRSRWSSRFPSPLLGIGLLVAWIVHQIRGNPTTAPAATAPGRRRPRPSRRRRRHRRRPGVVVPADWVAESEPPAGLTFRHPAGLDPPHGAAGDPAVRARSRPARRPRASKESAPASRPTADPSQALQQFVARAYGGQPQVQNGPDHRRRRRRTPASSSKSSATCARGVPVRGRGARLRLGRAQRGRPGPGGERSARAGRPARGHRRGLAAAHWLIGSTVSSEMLRSSGMTVAGAAEPLWLSRTHVAVGVEGGCRRGHRDR